MVTCAAAHFREEFQTFNEGVNDFLSGVQGFLADALCELADIFREAFLMDIEGFVRTEGRAYLHFDGRIFLDLFMPFQGINRIVGCADECDVGLFDQSAYSHSRVVLQHVIALVPDLFRCFNSQRFLDAEILVQFKVAPVIHRIADGHFQCFREFHKTIKVRLVAGDVIFRCSVGTHDSPLVVVAEISSVRILSAEPYFRQVVEAPVLVDFLRGDVAVIVNQRHAVSVIVEQMLSGFCLQKEIPVHKCFHSLLPLIS